ncbi:MAG: hypothetical protein ACHQK8_03545 [Bacteroidia bacterium]
MRNFFCFIFISTLVISCKKNDSTNSNVDLTTDYFPVDVGHFWIYDVDSIILDNNSGSTVIDSSHHFQYKEIITANIMDDMGKPAQRLERYFRQNDSDTTWRNVNTWVIQRDNLRAQKIEENVRFVKLIFPLSLNLQWDGNMFNNINSLNNRTPQMYSVNFFDRPFSVNGNSYGKTLKVIEYVDTNAIEEIVQYEIYSRGIGMIYSLSDSINTQPVPNDSTGKTVSRGYRYRFKLKTFQ